MFKPIERADLNQISLTGMRAIVLAGLLMVAPRSLEEIRKSFLDLKLIEESHSDDILRIDINTLKVMGCEISRASAKTNYKYVLGKNPFTFEFQEGEINAIKKVYNKIKETADIALLLEYDELFKKLKDYIYDEEAKEELLGISALRYYDIDFIKELIEDCRTEKTLDIVYKKTTSINEDQKEIVAQSVVFKNDQVYLYGYDKEKEDTVTLNIKRIKSILSKKKEECKYEPKTIKIKYILTDFDIDSLDECEKVIEKRFGSYIVEGTYHNEFLALQRVLSFGPKCTVVEPSEFKAVLLSKLREMRKIYE